MNKFIKSKLEAVDLVLDWLLSLSNDGTMDRDICLHEIGSQDRRTLQPAFGDHKPL